jgi:hypothetical protein
VHCTGKLAHSHSHLRRILPHNRFSLPIKAANPYAPSAAKERERRKRGKESAFRQAQTLPTKMEIRVLHWPGMAGCVGYELVLMEVFTTTFGRRWSCAGGSLSLPYSRRVHFLCCASPFSHFLAIPALFEETGLWKYLLTQSSQMLSLSILSVG